MNQPPFRPSKVLTATHPNSTYRLTHSRQSLVTISNRNKTSHVADFDLRYVATRCPAFNHSSRPSSVFVGTMFDVRARLQPCRHRRETRAALAAEVTGCDLSYSLTSRCISNRQSPRLKRNVSYRKQTTASCSNREIIHGSMFRVSALRRSTNHESQVTNRGSLITNHYSPLTNTSHDHSS
jgi:hypothetical protein